MPLVITILAESHNKSVEIRSRPLMSRKASIHVYEVRPRKDHRGVDLISDALPFGRLWFPDNSTTIKNRSMG